MNIAEKLKKLAEKLAKKVSEIEPRLSAVVNEDGDIEGCFRGKTSQTYKFDIYVLDFQFNYAGYEAKKAFNEALKQIANDEKLIDCNRFSLD